MGYWGVKSYENDDAHDALDAAYEGVHGARYDEVMDDSNPLTFEQVEKQLASAETLAAALAAHAAEFGADQAAWDELARLAFAGIVVRHAELGVAPPEPQRHVAITFLEDEDIEWDEDVKRRLRRENEVRLLKRISTAPA